MSSPAQEFGPTSVSIEDIERDAGEANAGVDPSKLVLQGENIPEHLRGKTLMDALGHAKSLEDALRISEQGRQLAEMQAKQVASAPAPVEQPAPEPELTEEQLSELYQENPLKAIEYMNERAIRRAEQNLESRLGPLMTGSHAAAEQQARSKYAAEFELFGEEITSMVKSIPNAQSVMSNPAAWDQLIALVRGKTGNFERLLEHKSRAGAMAGLQNAQASQAENVGFQGSATTRHQVARTVAELDPIQKEIAEKLNMTPEDYIKWSKV